MVNKESLPSSGDSGEQKRFEEIELNKRRFLKAAGASVVTAGAFASTAEAEHGPSITAAFCGCTQVCVRSENSIAPDVIIAFKRKGSYEFCITNAFEVPYCLEIINEDTFRVKQPDNCREVSAERLFKAGCTIPEGSEPKIVAVKHQPREYCNPNNCARKALSNIKNKYPFVGEEGEENPATGCDEDDHPEVETLSSNDCHPSEFVRCE